MARALLFGLLCLAAASPMPQWQVVPDGQCCFGLQDSASGAVLQQEERQGEVFFNSGHPAGWYCIEPYNDRKLLWDDFKNTCYINWYEQFLCLDASPSSDEWTLVKKGSSRLLARNGDVTFWACPAKNGSELVWSPKKTSKTGCRKFNLKAHTLKGACS